MAAEVEKVASVALVTVARDDVEDAAVEIGSNARAKAQCFPLSAAGKSIVYLQALAFPSGVALLLAA